MKKIIDFLKNVNKKDSVIIVFHNDADGICSTAMLLKYLSFLEKDPFTISQPMPMDNNLIQKIKTTIPNKIIFVDLAADQQYATILKKLLPLADIAVIDHHRISTDLNKKGMIHYNPRFSRPSVYRSAAYCMYEILSKISDFEENLWITAIGIVADYEMKDSQKLVKQIRKKYSVEELFSSVFAKISDMIAASNSVRKIRPEHIVDLVTKAKKPEDILSNNELLEAYNLVEDEIKNVMEDTEKNSEIIKNYLFYNIHSKYNLRSPISSHLIKRYPKKNIIVYQKVGGKVKLSARSNLINIASKLRRAIEGLTASAGGHERAAGAFISSKDWEKFKQNLVK